MMKSLWKSAFICTLFFLSAVAYAENNSTNPPAMYHQHAMVQKDGVALAWVMALDKNEINAANYILTQKVNDDTKQYAEMMVKDHTQNLQKTRALSHYIHIKPMKTSMILAVIQNGKNELIQLRHLPNDQLDKKYIQAMVKGHSEALKKINAMIKQDNLNPQLEAHLKSTRDRIQIHLQRAKEIQANMS